MAEPTPGEDYSWWITAADMMGPVITATSFGVPPKPVPQSSPLTLARWMTMEKMGWLVSANANRTQL